MKAVFLAAGKGTRMEPLTEDTPKPLLPVAGKPIIQHSIDLLEEKVDEIIVVGGYRIEELEEYFSSTGIKIVEQEEAKGTADAALQAKEHIDGRTVILNGDDIYGEKILEAVEKESAVLASEVEKPENYGVFSTGSGTVKGIEEKPENPSSNLVNIGCYVVKPSFFDLLEDVEKSKRGEYEITDALAEYIEDEKVELVEADRWLPCSYPWQLVEANEKLMEEMERKVEVEVPETSAIKGNAIIKEGAEVKENTVIEGPALIKTGSEVGPGAYIRPGTVLMENTEVGKSEVKNSVIGEGTNIPHFNYVGDSYIGGNVNLGAGAKTANQNYKGKVEMEIKGELVDSGREKLGAIIASNAKIGTNVSIKPGRKVGFKSIVDSQEKVEKNVPSKSVLKDGEIHENRD